MTKVSLDGKWKLLCRTENIECEASVPGCNFLDLQTNGIIPDPFLKCNEKEVQWVGEKEWIYEKTFSVGKEFLSKENQILVFDMLDTLGEIYLNGIMLGKTANAYRQYQFDIKGTVKEKDNILCVVFKSVLPYIKDKQKRHPLPNLTEGEAGSCHIRKPAYHFGWDWAPHLLSCGITKHAYLRSYDSFLENVYVRQVHRDGKVFLDLSPSIVGVNNNIKVKYSLTYPDGNSYEYDGGEGQYRIEINAPELWWCNGLGEQPLYTLKATIDGKDWLKYEIGLRTIVLDKSKDKFGDNFCFIVNGVRIFARGANWVPTDSFISRTSKESVETLVLQAKNANMNMLRVWGGGYYESDEFYSACDKYGILVWQDCMFACSPYPYSDKDFIAETTAEIEYNVKRLRNHPSLALWCGNNEVEAMSAAWCYRPDVLVKAKPFFYNTLATNIAKHDESTPYHYGSPCGNVYLINVNSDNYGDTHLWQVWHGMRPLEHLSKRMTRFCSEFGLQSFPHPNTLKRINGGSLPDSLGSDVMKVHQKAVLGNSRAQYYVAKSFFLPEKLWDIAYLTQLCQAKCAEYATDNWRLNKGRCNGALYWQYNDCWGVTSWAGRDYYGNLKAVQYRAAHFNAPLCATLKKKGGHIEVYLINDSLHSDKYRVEYGIESFKGNKVFENRVFVDIDAQQILKIDSMKISGIKTRLKKQSVAFVYVYDKDGKCVCEKTVTLSKENKCNFFNPQISYKTDLTSNQYNIEISAEAFAYGIEISLDGIDCVFSDNYFNLLPNTSKKIHVEIAGKTKEELDKVLRIRSLYDITRAKHGKFKDFSLKTRVFLQPFNFGNWLYRTFE